MTGENRRASPRGGFRLNLAARAKVYRNMWQCPQCNYHNDDWDEACAKCAAPKPEPEPAPVAESEAANGQPAGAAPLEASMPAPGTLLPQPIPAPAKKKRDPVILLSLLLVVFMLLTLGLLGYIAWQRGMITLPLPAMTSQPATSDTDTALLMEDDATLAPVELDPLQTLAAAREREARPYLPLAEKLLVHREELALLSAPPPGMGDNLTAEQTAFLDQLNTKGQTLLTEYKEFEELANQDDHLETTGYQDALAEEFGNQFEEVTQLIGQIYGSNTSDMHNAYLLPDLIKATVAPGRRISLAKISETWSSALENRAQRKLDAQFPEEIQQLSARLEALKQVHRDFKEQLDALPPYEVRAGNLSKAGEDALVLLDGLMTAVEGLVQEHTEYTQTLSEIELSDHMQQLQDEFTKLAQEDHFFCFSEVCRLSVDDRNLEHPAYDALRQHYQFVDHVWPALSIEYLKAFDDSERNWHSKWD